MGGGGGLVASSLLVVGRVCGTGQHVCDASIFSSNVFVLWANIFGLSEFEMHIIQPRLHSQKKGKKSAQTFD
jgi:hypothetical protein